MNHVFTILSAAALIYSARALPVRGVEPAWVAEPRGRGTIGLVLPCVITLALCVWTAIHLNVNSRPTRGRIFAFKLVWVLMGIFTPELVLWCSLSQYLEACAVRKEILEIRSQGNADKLPPTMWQKFLAFVTRRKATQASTVEDFNMKLAFFVIMGGYALDFAPENTKVSPKAITARYFVKLYGDGMIKDNDLDIKPIEDKAKADGLAKFVVCMQALWLVVQGIGRLLNGLPLTLLELHTIMHVLCAVVMYVFWWHKPMDVRHPIDLGEKIDGFRDALRDGPHPALQNPDSSINGNDGVVPTKTGENVTATSDDAILPPNIASNKPAVTINTQTTAPVNDLGILLATLNYPPGTPKPLISLNIWNGYLKEQTREAIEQTEAAGQMSVVNSPSIPQDRPQDRSEMTLVSVLPDSGFLARCSKIWGAFKEKRYFFDKVKYILESYKHWHKTFRPWLLPPNELQSLETRFIRCRDTMTLGYNDVVDRARMIGPKNNVRGGFLSWTTFSTFAGLSLLYGGAHVAAWNSHFRTTVESLLWKISASVATSYVPLSLLVFPSFTKFDAYIQARTHRVWYQAVNVLGALAFVTYFGLGTIIFVTSRLFLTVESFLSLRSLPEGSFETVPWSNYWPHF